MSNIPVKIKCPACNKVLSVTNAAPNSVVTCPCGKQLKLSASGQSEKAQAPPNPRDKEPPSIFSDDDFAGLAPSAPPNPNTFPGVQNTSSQEIPKAKAANSYLRAARDSERESMSRDQSDYWWLGMFIKLNRILGIILAVIVSVVLVWVASTMVYGSLNAALNGQIAASGFVLGIGAVVLVVYGFFLFFYITCWFAFGELIAAILELTLNSRRSR